MLEFRTVFTPVDNTSANMIVEQENHYLKIDVKHVYRVEQYYEDESDYVPDTVHDHEGLTTFLLTKEEANRLRDMLNEWLKD